MRRIYNYKTAKQVKISGTTAIPYVDFLGKKIYVLSTAVTSGVTTDSVGAGVGDLALTTHATGRNKWFVSDGTNWVAIGDGGAGFTQGIGVTDPAALTSANSTEVTSPTTAEYNALRADVVALRAKLIELISSLEGGAIIATA